MQRVLGGGLGLGLLATVWWLLAFEPSPRTKPAATSKTADLETTTSLRPPSKPMRMPRTPSAAAVANASDAELILHTAKDACARDSAVVQVDLALPTGVPDIAGVHPAVALCNNGQLIHLTFARGEDTWIMLSSTPDGTELTVTDYGEDEEPTGYRTWLDGRLVETGEVTQNDQGVSGMLVFKNGKKSKRYESREGLVSASTAAAIEAHLETLGLDAEARAHERANYFDRRAYIVRESFHDDGSVAFRQESFEEDLGNGWLLNQLVADMDGDGVVESWFIEKRHIDGRSSAVVIADKNSDGRFEKLTRRLGDQDQAEVTSIDWPAGDVDLARLRGLLLDFP